MPQQLQQWHPRTSQLPECASRAGYGTVIRRWGISRLSVAGGKGYWLFCSKYCQNKAFDIGQWTATGIGQWTAASEVYT